jgi:LSD1 subclass zinc finger protein
MTGMQPRYAGFTLRTECTSCGMPLPLDRPAREVLCSQCQKTVAIPSPVWEWLVGAFEGDHRPLPGKMLTLTETVAGFRLHAQIANIVPRCEHCAAAYPVSELDPDQGRDFACTGCGDPASAWPAPDWLRHMVPTARQIISTDPGGATTPEGRPLDSSVEESVKPVAMPCPQCSGSLRITAEHERVITCQYCSTDVFLPDEIWRRLHPVKTVQWWYARYEGKTAEEKAADRQAAERAADLERKKRRAAIARQMLPVSWMMAVLFTLYQLAVPVLLYKRSALAGTFGSAGGATWAIALFSAGLYLIAMVACTRPMAVAHGGSWRNHAMGYGIGGLIFAPPVAGVIFALIALALFALGRRNPDEPASGVGRPIAIVYVALAILPQSLFFYFVT